MTICAITGCLVNKKKAERIHARRRAAERFHLDVTEEVRNLLKSKIKKGEGIFLYRNSRRVSVWSLSLNEQTYKVVYDKQRKEIVTFLPYESTRTESEAPGAA